MEAKPLVERVKVEYQGKVPFVNCDGDNPDTNALASKYGVLYVPTLIFIDGKGKVVGKLVGNIDEDNLKENVEKTFE